MLLCFFQRHLLSTKLIVQFAPMVCKCTDQHNAYTMCTRALPADIYKKNIRAEMYTDMERVHTHTNSCTFHTHTRTHAHAHAHAHTHAHAHAHRTRTRARTCVRTRTRTRRYAFKKNELMHVQQDTDISVPPSDRCRAL